MPSLYWAAYTASHPIRQRFDAFAESREAAIAALIQTVKRSGGVNFERDRERLMLDAADRAVVTIVKRGYGLRDEVLVYDRETDDA